MEETLMKLKKRINRKAWLKMVEQAKEKGKITEEEYQELTNDETADHI